MSEVTFLGHGDEEPEMAQQIHAPIQADPSRGSRSPDRFGRFPLPERHSGVRHPQPREAVGDTAPN